MSDQLIRGQYGVLESNPITSEIEATREAIDHKNPVHLGDPGLAKITRLRLISDVGLPFMDISYCYGEMKDGTPVWVILPAHNFSKKGYKREIVEMCKEAGVYGKGLGFFDDGVISRMW